MYNLLKSHLQSLVRSRQSGRVRGIWRVLVPVLVGFITFQLAGAAAVALGLSSGQMMVATFGATALVMVVALVISARHLDDRPIKEYGYHLSRGWWLDFIVGTGVGTLVVAMTFVFAQRAGSLQVTGSVSTPVGTTVVWLMVFLVAFIGVAFYEEFIYRGSFITNAVEGLTGRGLSHSLATAVALVASTTVFALIHFPGAIAADANLALVFVKTGLLGGLFGIAYLRTGELAFPMGLHLGVNYALLNVFGIGTEGTAGIPSLLTVETTATGPWSPARGIPIFVSILAGYVLVFGWTRWRHTNRTAQSQNPEPPSTSD